MMIMMLFFNLYIYIYIYIYILYICVRVCVCVCVCVCARARAKDANEAKYKYLIREGEKNVLDYYKNPEALVEYSNNMQFMDQCNLDKIHKVLFVYNDMIADIISNKHFHPKATDVFIRGRTLNIFIAFIIQSCFVGRNYIRQNPTQYLIITIPSREKRTSTI